MNVAPGAIMYQLPGANNFKYQIFLYIQGDNQDIWRLLKVNRPAEDIVIPAIIDYMDFKTAVRNILTEIIDNDDIVLNNVHIKDVYASCISTDSDIDVPNTHLYKLKPVPGFDDNYKMLIGRTIDYERPPGGNQNGQPLELIGRLGGAQLHPDLMNMAGHNNLNLPEGFDVIGYGQALQGGGRRRYRKHKKTHKRRPSRRPSRRSTRRRA